MRRLSEVVAALATAATLAMTSVRLLTFAFNSRDTNYA